MKYILYTYAFFLLCSCGNSATGSAESPCECPLEKETSYASDKTKDTVLYNNNTSASIEINTKVKKIIDMKIQAKGGLGNTSLTTKELFSEVVSDNKDLTQKLNIYINVACAYYTILCKDTSIPDSDKYKLKMKIIDDYKKDIAVIVDIEVEKVSSEKKLNDATKTTYNATMRQKKHENANSENRFYKNQQDLKDYVESIGKCVIDTFNPNRSQAKLMAETCAISVAKANLLQAVQGTLVRHESISEDHLNKKSLTQTESEGILKSYEQVGQTIYYGDIAEVRLRVRLNLSKN